MSGTFSYGYNALGWTTSATGISGTDVITHNALGRISDETGPSVVTPGHAYHWCNHRRAFPILTSPLRSI